DEVTIQVGPPAPVAVAGPDRAVGVRGTVVLDGSNSTDPEDDPLAYEWTVASTPLGATAALSSSSAAKPAFTWDGAGTYVLRLVVSDGIDRSAPDELVITAAELPPVAAVTAWTAANAGDDVVLDGSASTDPDGDALSYAWTLSRPAGSAAALSSATAATPSFVPDVPGTYRWTLVVSAAGATSEPATGTVEVLPGVAWLDHRVIDAEYSDALDQIVTVSSGPNRLNVVDPETATATSVALPLAPTSVSVSPDGTYAAVGHAANVSYVRLSPLALVKTWPVSADAGDVVLGGNGYAYVFPSSDQWVAIHSVNLATGAETLSGGWSIYDNTRARLHPSGTKIYGAENGISPSDIERYDVSGGTAMYAYDSPYHGDYAMCGDLWITDDGQRILTACGNVFRASDVAAEDMVYAGNVRPSGDQLGSFEIRHADHSAAAGRFLVAPGAPPTPYGWGGTDDTTVRVHSDAFLALEEVVTLPRAAAGGAVRDLYGRFVFWKADGSARYAIVQVEPEAGVLLDYAVVAF
ncbi:MAG TPA: PKD domain-containing protein, partial [Anaeromyxobacteraceae bacterium]|nr:PKD domain-containing protein [Anaeromyxobacteraceae bacterium]